MAGSTLHASKHCVPPDLGLAIAQAGLADTRAWVAYMGPQWCGEAGDAEQALEHSLQASRYLLSGKDDCVRRAAKVGELGHTCIRPTGTDQGHYSVAGRTSRGCRGHASSRSAGQRM